LTPLISKQKENKGPAWSEKKKRSSLSKGKKKGNRSNPSFERDWVVGHDEKGEAYSANFKKTYKTGVPLTKSQPDKEKNVCLTDRVIELESANLRNQ